MKLYSLFAIFSISILAILTFTGFQCGSTEMTSAKLYISRSDWPNAEKALQKEVVKTPNNAEAWWNLGYVRYQMGNWEDMLSAFDNSLKNGKEFEKNIIEYKKSAWSKLINQGVGFQRAIATAPKDSTDLLFTKSERAYKIAIKINPDSTLTYENMAGLYRVNGKTDEEITTWRQLLQVNKDPGFTIDLINAEIRGSNEAKEKGDTVKSHAILNNALEDLKTARTTDPNNSDLLSTMITLDLASGKLNEAKPYLREAIIKDPDNKNNHFNLGLALSQNDSLDEAIQQYEAAIKIDSTFTAAVQNAGATYLLLGQRIKDSMGEDAKKSKNADKEYMPKFKKAVTLFEHLVDLKPDNANFWDILATAYLNAGNTSGARKAQEKADNLRKK